MKISALHKHAVGLVLTTLVAGCGDTFPTAAPVFDAHGAMYGTTTAGGMDRCSYLQNAPGCGTIYKLTPSASGYTERTIYRFRGRRDGANPMAGLTLRGNTLHGNVRRHEANGRRLLVDAGAKG